jgi:hypothetical protein
MQIDITLFNQFNQISSKKLISIRRYEKKDFIITILLFALFGIVYTSVLDKFSYQVVVGNATEIIITNFYSLR